MVVLLEQILLIVLVELDQLLLAHFFQLLDLPGPFFDLVSQLAALLRLLILQLPQLVVDVALKHLEFLLDSLLCVLLFVLIIVVDVLDPELELLDLVL